MACTLCTPSISLPVFLSFSYSFSFVMIFLLSLFVTFSLSVYFSHQIAASVKVFVLECIMKVIRLSVIESCACSMPFTVLVFLSE